MQLLPCSCITHHSHNPPGYCILQRTKALPEMPRQTPAQARINSTTCYCCRTGTQREKRLFSSSASKENFLPGATGSLAQLSVRQAPGERKSPPRSETRTLISEDSRSHRPRDFRGGWWYLVVYRTESKLDWKALTLGS